MKKIKTSQASFTHARTFRTRLMALAVSSCFSGASYALGVNPNVVAGAANISQAGNVMTVTNSNGTIINWGALSVLSGEKLIFDQAASSSVLNRVIGMNVNGKWVIDPTIIAGSISSKGSVWIINTSGLLVKQGAMIDVARFVGSTIDVSNANFRAGKLLFDGTPGTGSVVVEQGASITTGTGGSVYLVGSNVTNNGIITTPEGETILAAGQSVSIVDTGTPGVKVEITGSEGNVTNLGTVLAEAGRIGMAGALVRNSGTLNASSVVKEGGRIFLKASQDVYVDGDGRIVSTGTKGGSVEVLGNRVAVMDNASIDVSGTSGGGTVLVGGDYQGKNAAIQNSTVTYFGQNASIKADATNKGDGGKVIVWADDTTRAYGSISARGGANGGNGGFVETSGHNYLDVSGIRVNAGSPQGKAGQWLLDPSDVNIVHSGTNNQIDGPPFVPTQSGSTPSTLLDSTINAALSSNTDVIVTTNNSFGTGNGDITIGAGVAIAKTNGGAGSLTLNADRNITMTGAMIRGTASNPLDVNFSAGLSNPNGSISITNSVIETYGGAMSLIAAKDISITGLSAPTANSGLTYGGTVLSTAGCFSGSPSGCTPYAVGTTNGTAAAAQVIRAGYDYSGQSQKVGVGTLTLQGANSGNYGGVLVVSGGGQDIYADSMAMKGGSAGQNNGVIVANYSSQAQNVTVNRLVLTAGGSAATDFNDGASLYSSDGQQSIAITGANGSITLTGGAGGNDVAAGKVSDANYDSDCATATGAATFCYRSNNAAEILHRSANSAYGQSITFDSEGGKIALYGGSVGAGNSARIANESANGIDSPGAQIIGDLTYRPDIYIQGGSSGGKIIYQNGETYDIRNMAGIESDADSMSVYGSMSVYAGNITLNGGGGTGAVTGAVIGGGPQGGGGTINIDASGDVTLNGGTSGTVTAVNDSTYTTSLSSPAAIGSDKDVTVNLTVGGDLTLKSGSNVGGKALIGSLNGFANVFAQVGGDVELTSTGAGVGIGSHADLNHGYAGGAYIALNAGGSITLSASSSNSYGTFIGALNNQAGASTVLVSAGGDVVLDGGGGLGALIGVKNSYVSGNQVAVTAGQAYIGNNWVGVGGNVQMSDHAYIKAGDGINGGEASVNAYGDTGGVKGKAIIDTVIGGDESHGNVYINAVNAVLDNNGGAVNAVAGHIDLTSYYGGQAGGLAISLDTRTAGSLSAYSNGCGDCFTPPVGGYGGISLRNYSSTAPTSVTLRDDATYGGNISFYNKTAFSTDILDASTKTGDMMITSGGKLTIYGGIAGGITDVASGHDLMFGGTSIDFDTSGGSFATPGSLQLAAPVIDIHGGGGETAIQADGNVIINGGLVTVGHGDATGVTGNNIGVVANSLIMDTGDFFATGTGTDGNIVLGTTAQPIGSIYATHYSRVEATNKVVMRVAGDIRLNDMTDVVAGDDVIMNLYGSTSTLYLNDVAGLAHVTVLSDAVTRVMGTTHLNFLGRSSGGVVIDGVAGTTTMVGGTGFYAVDLNTPATLGAGLVATYATTNSAATATTNVITQVLNTSKNNTELSDDKPAATTLVLKPVTTVASSTPSTQTVGGDSEDSFGGTEKKDDVKKDTTNNSDTKEKSNGKSTSKNQCS